MKIKHYRILIAWLRHMPLFHFAEAMRLLVESDDETSDDRSPPTMVSKGMGGKISPISPQKNMLLSGVLREFDN